MVRRAQTPVGRRAAEIRPLRLGRDSVAFRVIAERPQLGLFAGVPALVLQVLHPAIAAGVHAHSSVMRDPLARLRETADYVAGTAFGDDETARDLIRRVNRRHRPVRGTNPVDGSPFSADDPELQAYVHTTEMWAFLEAFRFAGENLGRDAEDAYWAELEPIGSLLGAPPELIPGSVDEAQRLLEKMESELVATRESREIIGFLLAPRGSALFTALAPARPLNRRVAAAMLPPAPRRLAGLPEPAGIDRALRAALRAGDRATGPLARRLALRLAGPNALEFNRSIPARTEPRGFNVADAWELR